LDFELTADQQIFRRATRDFLERETPLTKVRELHSRGVGFDLDWWRRGAELGWTSMLVPAQFGGGSVSGCGVRDLSIIAEEQGRMVSPGPLVATNVVAAALAEANTYDSHAEIIEEIVAGTAIATSAICEVDAGWDPGATTLSATDERGLVVLSGVKDLVEAGDQADYFLVTARGSQGLSQYIVESSLPGVSVTPMVGIDIVRRFARVRFDDVRLPSGALVSEGADAAHAIERELQIAAVLQCAEIAGVAERVFEFTLKWMFDRYSFGRPLASYQALKHRVAEMKMWLEASHGIAAAAARAVQEASPQAAELVSIAKSYVGQHATDLIQDCVQIHGGIGVTWEHDIHLYLRRATVDRATWGTPAEHRERIARLIGI
jgi:alkylation response protein AidB-like acyl-CoA dehydrogenase